MDNFVSVDGFVDGFVDKLGNERTTACVLPNEKLSFYDRVLTDADTPVIQETVYLILVFQTR